MIELNEEEIDKLHSKLHMLEKCCDIIDLGFKYKEEDCVIIDVFAEEGGYYGPTELDMIETIIRPTVEDGEIGSNCNNMDLLKEICAAIPYSTYDEDSVVGFYVHIDNYITKKFISYNLTPDKNVEIAIKRMKGINWYNESTVEDIQIIFRKEGLYIIYPEEYACVDEYIDSYTLFLSSMKEQVEDYENNLKEEAA